jgi:hypothetical protein
MEASNQGQLTVFTGRGILSQVRRFPLGLAVDADFHHSLPDPSG